MKILSAINDDILRPIRAFRPTYLPLLMVYFAYGALGLIDVSRDMWIKESLTLNPAELASISVWLALPWTVKMVFGEMVDSVPLLGSQRRAYVWFGAGLTAVGLVILAGAAGKWLAFLPADQLYLLGAMLMVIGAVIQDVVADAMSTEVVARVDADGKPRNDDDVRHELGMVQVLGRLALSFGTLAVAGASGWAASIWSRETVFLAGLVVPLISVTGVMLIRAETSERRPIDWRILGGGIAFGAVVTALGVGGVPYSQEIVFVVSMAVICGMLVFVTRDLDHKSRLAIFYTSIIIFAFRAVPSVGDGYFWFTLDVLKFDESFYGSLRQTSALIGIVAIWLLAKQLTGYSIVKTMFWLTIIGTVLSLPDVALYFGIHEWTERVFGFGARSIALVNAAASSPFVDLSMIPLLALIAYYAPAGHRATWFALMASLTNLALVAGELQTKYLNQIFVIGRGEYSQLGGLMIADLVLGLVIPIGAIILFGRRV